ncbi:MAG: YbaB/EbfC family nucleoid-associated protein [Candidatus Aminicenantes bacterium]|nr:YbaB/EbfC family nucleoid-associated protein [Candidatus Aminicenantes bacterium]MDH5707253.1 YbaB/EbfC family nucleoid-associated protein [Candidatus Aminicenantes bacterium]
MKGVANLQKMIKTAKEMQEKLQKELAEMRVEGTSGGGMVTVTLDGQKNLMSIRIDPEVVNKDDVEMLQDLIIAAFNDAGTKVDEELSQKMGGLGMGLKIPGLF